MKRTLPAILLVLAAAQLAAQPAGYGPLALTLATGPRVLAMANIGVAGRDDDVIFFNPAQLTVARGTSVSFARMSASARGATLSTVLRLGSAGIGFGVNHLEYQAPAIPYPSNFPLNREQILDRNLRLGTSTLGTIGYAQVYRGFRLGVSANYAADAINAERFGNLFGDFGIGRDFGRYSTALAVQHLGTGVDHAGSNVKPPATATLGVATTRQLGPLDAYATAAAIGNQEEVSGAFGVEMGWSWLSGYTIAGRAGVHQPSRVGVADYTAGVGFTADRVSIDVAAELLSRDRVSYRAGVRIR